MFQLQAIWIARVLSGAVQLPPREVMEKEVKEFYSQLEADGVPKRHTHLMVPPWRPIEPLAPLNVSV